MDKKYNSTKHGLLRKKLKLMPDESRYLFNKMNRNLMEYWQPDNLAESMLVEQLTFNYWRLRRAFRLETEFFMDANDEAQDNAKTYQRIGVDRKAYSSRHLNFDNFDKFTRYINSIQRQNIKILRELEQLKAAKKGLIGQTPRQLIMDS